ncbi:hypothetical protein [Terrabacter sp. RAF57]|uniref:hypothetical protein n=1 Tax=Terrabacter sp. RAF57 TaxID=3233063 RepID=UPI003F96D431
MPELEGIGLGAGRLGVGGRGLDVRFHRLRVRLAGPVIRSDVVAGLRFRAALVDAALVDAALVDAALVGRPRHIMGSGRGVRLRRGVDDLAGAGASHLGSVRCLRLVARRLGSRLCLLPVACFT